MQDQSIPGSHSIKMKKVSGPVLGKGPWKLLANLKPQVVIHHRGDYRFKRWSERIYGQSLGRVPISPRTTVNHLYIFDGLKTDFENSHWSQVSVKLSWGRSFQWSETRSFTETWPSSSLSLDTEQAWYLRSLREELIATNPLLYQRSP